MDSVVHFEIPTDDMDRASKFYSGVFGWEIQPMPEMKYGMAITTPLGEDRMPNKPGAINGGFFHRQDDLKTASFAIDVPDIDAALEKVKAAGGTLLREKVSIGEGMGSIAYFKDTEGNVISLWENPKK